MLAGAPSVIGLDMVSLMPADRWVGPVNGKSVLRKDLGEKIAAMNPGFLRFPGGCVTNVGTFRTYEESGYTDRRRTYQWKETIGPVEERPANWNFWGYNQSYGIGYLEYFELAEDLGAEPLPVVSVGANGCGGAGIPEMHDPAQIDRWVDDTVDLIEFANGGTDTEWGAKRAALGHPEPFGLDMIGLGNEENTTTFEQNFPEFRDAIKAPLPGHQDHLELRPGLLRRPLRHPLGLQPGAEGRPGRRALLPRPAVVPGEQRPLRLLRPRGPEGLPR